MSALLAVDTAKSSGWCLLDAGGKYVASGQCDAFSDAPRELCARAVALDPKAVLVMESAFGGNRATLVGLGAARGVWIAAWRWANGRKTLTRTKSVMPQTWRSQLFGSNASFALQERLTAQLITCKHEVGKDEAAAVCIARWAATRAEIERKAPAPNAHRVRNDRRDRRSNHFHDSD